MGRLSITLRPTHHHHYGRWRAEALLRCTNPTVIQRVLSRQRGTRWFSIKTWPSLGYAHALSERTTLAEEPYTTTVRFFYLLGDNKKQR